MKKRLPEMMKQRKTPIRTCIACRTSSDKCELVRVVRTPTGEIMVDLTGKMPGRGAYLCRQEECLRRAVKERRLARCLRTEIPAETTDQLEQTFKQGTEHM